jgi:hypothetical protein
MVNKALKRELQVNPTNPPQTKQIKSLGAKYGALAGVVASFLAFGSVGCAPICYRYHKLSMAEHEPQKARLKYLGRCEEGIMDYVDGLKTTPYHSKFYAEALGLAAVQNPDFVIPILNELLEDKSLYIRRHAAIAFSSPAKGLDISRYKGVIGNLVPFLGDADVKVRSSVSESLINAAGFNPGNVLPPVRDFVKTSSGEGRAAALKVLLLGSPDAKAAMQHFGDLSAAGDEALGEAIGQALYEGAADFPNRFVPYLQEFMKHENAGLREQVARAVSKLVKHVYAHERSSSYLCGRKAHYAGTTHVDTLAGTRSSAYYGHEPIFCTDMTPEEFRTTYSKFNPAEFSGFITSLAALLADPEPKVRKNAITAFRTISETLYPTGIKDFPEGHIDFRRYKGALKKITGLCNDGDAEIREAATETVENLKRCHLYPTKE